MSDVDAMDLNELRLAIAERLGWTFWQRHVGGYSALAPKDDSPSALWTQVNAENVGEFSGVDVPPDWPRDIAAADELLDDLDKRGLSYTLTNKGLGFHVVVSRGMTGSIWSIGRGEIRPEAIARAWLKARHGSERVA